MEDEVEKRDLLNHNYKEQMTGIDDRASGYKFGHLRYIERKKFCFSCGILAFWLSYSDTNFLLQIR